MCADKMSEITLYDLSTSRSIRTAWLLEELQLRYNVVHAERNGSGLSDSSFKKQIGTYMGKAPTLTDGELVIQESGAIAEYLCEKYDHKNVMLPPLERPKERNKAREFVHAAEGTWMIHALPFLYANRVDPVAAKGLRPKLAAIVQKDLDWLETELESKGGGWLVGEDATVADTMVGFSIQFIFLNRLAGEDVIVGRWKRIKEWLDLMETRGAYKRAVEKTSYTLRPQVGGGAEK